MADVLRFNGSSLLRPESTRRDPARGDRTTVDPPAFDRFDPGVDLRKGRRDPDLRKPLPVVDATRVSPWAWLRNRRVERVNRRADAAHQRTAERMAALGHDWRVLDLQATAGSDRMSFLALGPGGVFAVTVKDHGRSRVSFAGDVVQVDGRRPKYVEGARKTAKLAATALTRSTGVSVPVLPVLAFAGSGIIAVYGMPKGVIVTSYGELSRVLNSRGRRLAQNTVTKLYTLAADPATWVNPQYVPLAERYKWYAEGTGSADRGSADKGSVAE